MNDKTETERAAPGEDNASGAGESTSTRQLLFYEQATPLSKERHAKWSVELGRDYAFARATNSVPLTRVEFARAAREYVHGIREGFQHGLLTTDIVDSA